MHTLTLRSHYSASELLRADCAHFLEFAALKNIELLSTFDPEHEYSPEYPELPNATIVPDWQSDIENPTLCGWFPVEDLMLILLRFRELKTLTTS